MSGFFQVIYYGKEYFERQILAVWSPKYRPQSLANYVQGVSCQMFLLPLLWTAVGPAGYTLGSGILAAGTEACS